MEYKSNHLFCFGLGYVGTALAEALLQHGWHVSGTTRDSKRAKALLSMGIKAFDVEEQPSQAMLDAIENASHILICVPPGNAGDVIYKHYLPYLIKMTSLRWFGYLSSTVVYGDKQGGWVDEDTPIEPNNERGRWRAEAERNWQDSTLPSHIFRISGIYGPRRNSLIKVKKGEAKSILKEGHVFCRIHLDDIVATLIASMNKPNAGAIYNLADDEPAPSHELISYAAQLLGMTAPKAIPIEEAGLSMMAKSFYDGCRRVHNDKIKQELGIQLKYPTYREGLEALLQSFTST